MDTGVHSKDTGRHSKDTGRHSKDTCVHSKDTGRHSKDTGRHTSKDTGKLILTEQLTQWLYLEISKKQKYTSIVLIRQQQSVIHFTNMTLLLS